MGKSAEEVRDFFNRKFVQLPGGFGTSLQLQGYKLKPEAWSGEANLTVPDKIREVHALFHDTGADIHTTNTFRTHPAFMRRAHAKIGDEGVQRLLRSHRDQSALFRDFRSIGEELSYWASKRAVDAALVVQQSSSRPVLIGGSFGPLGDTHSFDPNNAIPFKELRKGHKEQAALLKELGVDLLFPETIPTFSEAIAMAGAAEETGLPYITSFVFDPETGKLFDGTTIEEAIQATSSENRLAVLFNCTPAYAIGPAIDKALACGSKYYVGAYANGGGGPAEDKSGWDHDEREKTIEASVNSVARWAAKDSRAKIFGFCCGGSPAYSKALNETFREAPTQPRRRPRFVAEANPPVRAKCDCHPAFSS